MPFLVNYSFLNGYTGFGLPIQNHIDKKLFQSKTETFRILLVLRLKLCFQKSFLFFYWTNSMASRIASILSSFKHYFTTNLRICDFNVLLHFLAMFFRLRLKILPKGEHLQFGNLYQQENMTN